LRQKPAPELAKLRGKPYTETEIRLESSSHVLEGANGQALEILAEIDNPATTVGLKVCRSPDGKRAVIVRFDGRELEVAGIKAPFKLSSVEKTLSLRVFVDRSV